MIQAKINGNTTTTAAGILADAASKTPPPLVTFIVYDLPNRVRELASGRRRYSACAHPPDPT